MCVTALTAATHLANVAAHNVRYATDERWVAAIPRLRAWRNVRKPTAQTTREQIMSIGTILLILLILILVGALPSWPHSRSWGYGPSGGVGLVLLILVILMLAGRL